MGLRVWISRSQPGADRQARSLQAAGHWPLVAPVIDVRPCPAEPPRGRFDVAIFLSEHAVDLGYDDLVSAGALSGAELLAVGARTAEVLEGHGAPARTPERATSEGLLESPALRRPAGLRVLLVGGVGGRTLLADDLGARGARVERFECYRREPVTAVSSAVVTCDAAIAASGEGLRRLAALWLGLGGREDLPVLVPSDRVARLASEVGLRRLHDCGGADSDAWLRGLAKLDSVGMP